MVYMTGDLHGDEFRLLQKVNSFTQEDILLVCGDFGFIFDNSARENRFLDKLEKLPCRIAFIQGNHENFPAIASYPQEEWHGGKIHRIRKNIMHLMQGQVFEIENKTYFTMGGAFSIDRAFRTEGKDFWPEEIPTQADFEEGRRNLLKHKNTVDVIVTHTGPALAYQLFGFDGHEEEWELMQFFSELEEKCNYGTWYFGHFHADRILTNKLIATYLYTYPIV